MKQTFQRSFTVYSELTLIEFQINKIHNVSFDIINKFYKSNLFNINCFLTMSKINCKRFRQNRANLCSRKLFTVTVHFNYDRTVQLFTMSCIAPVRNE